jgi:hypothetical protein
MVDAKKHFGKFRHSCTFNLTLLSISCCSSFGKNIHLLFQSEEKFLQIFANKSKSCLFQLLQRDKYSA